jgi:hypothetical protein
MTVWVADARAHVQRLVSVVKVAIGLEGVLSKNSVLLCVFYGQKDSVQTIFSKKCLPFLWWEVFVASGGSKVNQGIPSWRFESRR